MAVDVTVPEGQAQMVKMVDWVRGQEQLSAAAVAGEPRLLVQTGLLRMEEMAVLALHLRSPGRQWPGLVVVVEVPIRDPH